MPQHENGKKNGKGYDDCNLQQDGYVSSGLLAELDFAARYAGGNELDRWNFQQAQEAVRRRAREVAQGKR